MLDKFGPEDHPMRCGRMISGSKIALNDDVCVWNANLYTKEQGKIWYGDINLTTEGAYVADLAKELGETIYVLREMDCRFISETKPDLSKAVEVFGIEYTPSGGIFGQLMRAIKENKMIKAFTDYPLFEEEYGKIAPIRAITVLSYDEDKYCKISFEGVEYEVKRGYLYVKPGRCGEVATISIPDNFPVTEYD